MAVFVSMYIFSILGFLIHLNRTPSRERTKGKIVELLLLYQIIFSIGITSLLAFFGLTFMADYIADYMGWPASPFQQELGNVNLAFGILGILAIWFRGHFWTATVLGFSIWIFSDGLQHIYQMLWDNNYAPGNIGIMPITDISVPLIVTFLLCLYLKYNMPFKNLSFACVEAKRSRTKD